MSEVLTILQEIVRIANCDLCKYCKECTTSGLPDKCVASLDYFKKLLENLEK